MKKIPDEFYFGMVSAIRKNNAILETKKQELKKAFLGAPKNSKTREHLKNIYDHYVDREYTPRKINKIRNIKNLTPSLKAKISKRYKASIGIPPDTTLIKSLPHKIRGESDENYWNRIRKNNKSIGMDEYQTFIYFKTRNSDAKYGKDGLLTWMDATYIYKLIPIERGKFLKSPTKTLKALWNKHQPDSASLVHTNYQGRDSVTLEELIDLIKKLLRGNSDSDPQNNPNVLTALCFRWFSDRQFVGMNLEANQNDKTKKQLPRDTKKPNKTLRSSRR